MYYSSRFGRSDLSTGGDSMKRPKRRCRRNSGVFLALAAFLGAVMCVSFFSVKVLLFSVAILFIVLGLFLLRL